MKIFQFLYWMKLVYIRDKKINLLKSEIKRLNESIMLINNENIETKKQLEYYKEENFRKDSEKGQ